MHLSHPAHRTLQIISAWPKIRYSELSDGPLWTRTENPDLVLPTLPLAHTERAFNTKSHRTRDTRHTLRISRPPTTAQMSQDTLCMLIFFQGPVSGEGKKGYCSM